MNTFDDRKDAFEKKFAHDAALQFKAAARRNKLLGLWAAELMGVAGAKAEEYAKTVVMADLDEAGDDDVVRKVAADFDAAGVSQSADQINAKMKEFMAEAIRQLQTEG